MEEDFPNEFDLIVLGTGMPESILAAAAARSGKSVLHLDQNDFYGSDWGSFNFDNILQWAKNHQEANEPCMELNNTVPEHVSDGEVLVILPTKLKSSFNVRVQEFVPQIIKTEDEEVNNSTSQPKEVSPTETVESTETVQETLENVNKTDNKQVEIDTSKSQTEDSNVMKPVQKRWSLDELHKQKRKFNIDLAPKLLFARGPLVELLIQSNMSRYSEFKCSSQILTLLDGKLMPVPCSRADVFSTKHVSIVEKRMLMKFLKFCLDFEEHPEEFADFENKPFVKFLSSKKLTKNVEHYLIHSIAMVDPSNPTLDSLKRIQKFLQSLGRYSNSPFLFPLYGSGEIPQCFCRLCAVFGGIYCLKQQVDALILNDKNECVAAVIKNKRINCKFFAMECGYSPKNYLPKEILDRKVSKAILVTDGSIYPSEQDQLTFLRLPASETFPNSVSVLELGPGSNVCPDGLKLVYMNCKSREAFSEDDLLPAVQLLFNLNGSADAKPEAQDEHSNKPNILWAMYLNQYDNLQLELNENTPKNVFLLPTTDIEQDYENAIKRARAIFVEMFPSEEFLPRAPDPEEIIMDSDEPEKNGEKNSEDTEKTDDSEKVNVESVETGVGELKVEETSQSISKEDPDKSTVPSEQND